MSIYRISTNFGDRYTSATSAAKARANVAYLLRRYVDYALAARRRRVLPSS